MISLHWLPGCWLWPAYQPRLLWTLEVWTSRLEFSFSNSLLISYFIYVWLAALLMKISKFLKGSTSQYCVKTEWLNWLKIKEKKSNKSLVIDSFWSWRCHHKCYLSRQISPDHPGDPISPWFLPILFPIQSSHRFLKLSEWFLHNFICSNLLSAWILNLLYIVYYY